MIWNNGDSYAQADALIDCRYTNTRNGGSKPFGCLQGALYACGRQQNEELLSPVSSSEVAGT